MSESGALRRPACRLQTAMAPTTPNATSNRIAASGFTLIELVIVIIIAGIIAAVVGTKWNARSATAPFQAEVLARNIRHAQMLALTWNTPVGMRVPSTTSYEFWCTNATPPASCMSPNPLPIPPNNPVNDPAMGGPFRVDLDHGVTIASIGGPPPRFNNLGIPLNALGAPITVAHVLQLDAGGTTWSVTIQPLTGFVQVASP